jgi:hypothetical protein
MTQLKWLMYFSEEPKLATNLSQRPQLRSEFQTRKLLERDQSDAPSPGLQPYLHFTGLCHCTATTLAQLHAISHKHLGCNHISTLLASATVQLPRWHNFTRSVTSTNTLPAARTPSPSLQQLCNFLGWR